MIPNERENSLQGLFLKITHEYFVKNFRQFMDIGIHPGQIPVLRILNAEKGLSQKEIARELHIKPPTVTMTIKRLEKAGYVRRAQDQRDQRIVRIFLTEEGQKANARIEEVMDNNERILAKGFSQTELCLFYRFFQQMLENIESIPADTKGCLPDEWIQEGGKHLC